MGAGRESPGGWAAIAGLAALVFVGQAGVATETAEAGVMKIESAPQVVDWVRGSAVEYEVQVRADTSAIDDGKKIGIASWHFTVPSGLESYLTFVMASLPDGANNPSRPSSGDLFSNVLMEPPGSNYNCVKNVVGGESSGNDREHKNVGDGVLKGVEGILGIYWFTVTSDVPLGVYNCGLHSIYFYDTDGAAYKLSSSNLAITNQQFRIVPAGAEDVTLTAQAVDPADTYQKVASWVGFNIVGDEGIWKENAFGEKTLLNLLYRVSLWEDVGGDGDRGNDVQVLHDTDADGVPDTAVAVDNDVVFILRNAESRERYLLADGRYSFYSIMFGIPEFEVEHDSWVYAKVEDLSGADAGRTWFAEGYSPGVFVYYTPEPATLGLLGLGAAAALGVNKRKGRAGAGGPR